jgi:hypothetical protein
MFDKMLQRYCPCSFDQRIAHVKMWLIYAIFYAFSLDNESFLDSMKVTSHEDFVGSQDTPSKGFVQPQLYEDEEGFVEDGGVSRCTVNHSNQEDLVIILAWKKVGFDPAVGTEQAGDTYWERMKEFFDAHNPHGNERSSKSICHRWRNIQSDCQKWSACDDPQV